MKGNLTYSERVTVFDVAAIFDFKSKVGSCEAWA